MEQSLEHLEALDTERLATQDLERALPLLTDMTELLRGDAAAAAIVSRAVDAAGTDTAARRALVLALASDVGYGVHGGRRAAATEAISCAETAGPAASPALHRALLNLVVAKVTAAEGLDTALLDRADAWNGLPSGPAARHAAETAGLVSLHRRPGSRVRC